MTMRDLIKRAELLAKNTAQAKEIERLKKQIYAERESHRWFKRIERLQVKVEAIEAEVKRLSSVVTTLERRR